MADTATLLAYTIPNALQQTISIISTNLLYPVMIVLIILIAGSLTELGGFFFEWRNRNRDLGRMEGCGGSEATGGKFTEEITDKILQEVKFATFGGGGAGMFSLTEWIMNGVV